MRINKIINRRIRERLGHVDFAGDVNAVVAANVNEPSSTTSVSSRQTVVQRTGARRGNEREAHRAEELPDRQAMSTITPGIERPVPLDGIPIDPNPDSA